MKTHRGHIDITGTTLRNEIPSLFILFLCVCVHVYMHVHSFLASVRTMYIILSRYSLHMHR